MTEANRQNFQTLQALRALAASVVVLYHLDCALNKVFHSHVLDAWFKFGGAGVDLFFVLSGFVIYYSSQGLIHSGRVAEYLFKRFVRVYPIYWLVLLFFFAFGMMGPARTAQPHTLDHLLWSASLFFGHTAYNGVSWTLSFEIYFYLLFVPLILSRRLAIVPLAVLAISLLRMLWTPPSVYETLPDYLFSRLNLEFALGVLAALLFLHGPRPTKVHCQVGVALSLVTCWLACRTGMEDLLAFGVPSFLAVWSLVHWENLGMGPWFQSRLGRMLLFVGNASYVLYLIHLPILKVGNKIMAKLALSGGGLLVGELLLLSLIYFLSGWLHLRVELPLVKALRPRRGSALGGTASK